MTLTLAPYFLFDFFFAVLDPPFFSLRSPDFQLFLDLPWSGGVVQLV